MAEPEYGAPCPGCTVEKITAQMARFPSAYPLCTACCESGALYHAKFKKDRDEDNAQECAGRASGIANGALRQAQDERSDA